MTPSIPTRPYSIPVQGDRFASLQAICGSDAKQCKLARCVKPDPAEVRADAERLPSTGLIDRTDGGELVFRYAEVALQFDWRTAA